MVLGLDPELLPGREILATSFGDARSTFTIRVSSSEMARGGTAVVLKGEVFSPVPTVVALKVVMDAGKGDSDDYHERVRREIASVQKIQHRYILPFLGVVVREAYTVLVSKFMDNGDLLEYLKINPAANRRSLIIQIAEAVDYLHTKARLVHGDLKCQNVLVSPDGDAQLSDFGLSTIVDKRLSIPTTIIGIRQLYTLQFAAPELLFDEATSISGKRRSKTAQTDVFAFGRLILQAFNGTVPWPDLPLYVVFNKVLRNFIPERRDEATALGLDDKLWSTCLACWRTVPLERPTMAKIMLELSECCSSRKTPKLWSIPSRLAKRVRPPNPFVPPVGSAELVHAQSSTLSHVSRITRAALTMVLMQLPGSTTVASGIGMSLSHGFQCACCQQLIVGIRYQCATCPSSPDSYNLCALCEIKSYIVHNNTHIFFKVPRPVKRQIASPFPFVPPLYSNPAGLFPGGTCDDTDPECYLITVSNRIAGCYKCYNMIEGKWYRCAYCGEDLCHACEAIGKHDDSHVFVVFKAEVNSDLFRTFVGLGTPRPLIQYPIY